MPKKRIKIKMLTQLLIKNRGNLYLIHLVISVFDIYRTPHIAKFEQIQFYGFDS